MMAQRCMVGGNPYDIKGGRVNVNGKVFDIVKGRVMVEGDVCDILFSFPVTINITSTSSFMSGQVVIQIDGTECDDLGTFTLEQVNEITVARKIGNSYVGAVYFNGVEVSNPYTFTPTTGIVNIHDNATASRTMVTTE